MALCAGFAGGCLSPLSYDSRLSYADHYKEHFIIPWTQAQVSSNEPMLSSDKSNCVYLRRRLHLIGQNLSLRIRGEDDRAILAFDPVVANDTDDSDNFACFAITCPMRYRHEGWRSEKACLREIELRSATHDPKYCEFCKRCLGDTLANGQRLRKLRKCGGCRWARYCGTACQRAHWRRHKERCCPGLIFEQSGIVGIGPTEPSRPPNASQADHIYCDICEILLQNSRQYAAHLRGYKHNKKIARASDASSSSTLAIAFPRVQEPVP